MTEVISETVTIMPGRARLLEMIRLLGLRLEQPAFRHEARLVLEDMWRAAVDDEDGEIIFRIDEILRRDVSPHGANTFSSESQLTLDLFRALYRSSMRPLSYRLRPALAPFRYAGATIIHETEQQEQQPVATADFISLYPSLFVPSAGTPVPSTTQVPDEDTSDDDDELPPLERVGEHAASSDNFHQSIVVDGGPTRAVTVHDSEQPVSMEH